MACLDSLITKTGLKGDCRGPTEFSTISNRSTRDTGGVRGAYNHSLSACSHRQELSQQVRSVKKTILLTYFARDLPYPLLTCATITLTLSSPPPANAAWTRARAVFDG